MPYDNAVPQAAQRISASQQPILNNFIEIDNDFALNHVPLTAGANNGKHNLVQFVSQLPAYVSVPVAGEFNMYNKIPSGAHPLSALQELFISRVGGFNIPMTAEHSTLAAPYYWSFLPSGWVIKCSSGATDAVGQQTVVMTGVNKIDYGPDFVRVPIVIVSAHNPLLANHLQPHINTQAVGVNGFTVEGGITTGVFNNVPFYWVAIGPTV